MAPTVTTLLLLFSHAAHAAAAVTDLSKDWEVEEEAATSSAAKRLESARSPDVKGYVVIENGKIVAEGYAPGWDDKRTTQIHSVTKSWASFLLGTLAPDVSTTLGSLFPDIEWSAVSDGDAKKEITLDQLLSMQSGIYDGEDRPLSATRSVVDALNYGDFSVDESGKFHYVNSHLLAYAVMALSGGLSPMAYASKAGVWEALGIAEDEMSWDANEEGVEFSEFGMSMSPRQMAKLGQLYLQDGAAADGVPPLVTADWVAESCSTHAGFPVPIQQWILGDLFDGGMFDEVSYGYRWWLPAGEKEGALCVAVGYAGQFVMIDKARGRVVAVTSRDFEEDYGPGAELLKIALDSRWTFDGGDDLPDDGGSDSPEDGGKDVGNSDSDSSPRRASLSAIAVALAAALY